MRSTLKQLAEGCALVCVLPALVAYQIAVLVIGKQRAFPGWSQAISLAPGLIGSYLRRAFYRRTLARCGDGAFLTFGTIFSHPTAYVGRNVYVGAFCCLGEVTLEDDVLIGSHVSIANGSRQHGTERLDIPVREQPGEWPRITVGADTWIGDRAVILADVGRHCVIGAGAVVTKPIPDFAVAVGIPARPVRFRNESQPVARRAPESLVNTAS